MAKSMDSFERANFKVLLLDYLWTGLLIFPHRSDIMFEFKVLRPILLQSPHHTQDNVQFTMMVCHLQHYPAHILLVQVLGLRMDVDLSATFADNPVLVFPIVLAQVSWVGDVDLANPSFGQLPLAKFSLVFAPRTYRFVGLNW